MIFPAPVFAPMRLSSQYRVRVSQYHDAFCIYCPELKTFERRHHVFACVSTVDIATFEALRYGKSLVAGTS